MSRITCGRLSKVPVSWDCWHFASPTGLRSGTTLKIKFEDVNRAPMPVHFLACRSRSTPTGPRSWEGSGREPRPNSCCRLAADGLVAVSRRFPRGDFDNLMHLVIGLSVHSSAIEDVDQDALWLALLRAVSRGPTRPDTRECLFAD